MYKLIAIDLDDTLLKNDLSISPVNKEAIKKASDMGVKVVLASGRANDAMKHFYSQLDIDTPIVSYQGAHIYDVQTGKYLHKKELSKQQIAPILELARQHDIHCNIYMIDQNGNDIIYFEKPTKWSEYYKGMDQKVKMSAAGNLSDYEFDYTIKLLLIEQHDVLANLKPTIEQQYGDGISVFFSKNIFLEMTNSEVSKGNALKFLSKKYGIPQQQIMAIGDTYNDLSMIEYAGLGVCMANGPEQVQKHADYVTLSNEQDGVAHAINKFILS